MMAFNIQSVKAEGTIYIRADGSIDPPTAPISTLDNVTYTLTGDISDPVVIERSSIVVEGAGQRVMGIGAEGSIGMYLSGSSNVTLVNMEITGFSYGIRLYYSSNNTIASSNVTASGRVGIDLYYSSNNSMLGNNVAGNVYGISLEVSSNNRIHGNIFTNDGLCVRMSYANSVENNTVNGRPLVYLEDVSDYNVQEAGQVILVRCHNIMVDGLSISETDIGIQLLETNSSIIAENKLANNLVSMYLWVSLNNTISGNNISDNFVGIWLYCSSNTRIFHNNFNNNTQQTKIDPDGYNAWDDGYPSGGNYWSDYAGVDANGDGIGDTPYVIDAGNQDRYPLMHLWSPLPVHNINTGLGYATIQEAINAPETLDRHTLFVESATYYENVVVNKTLSLIGENSETTIIDGNKTGSVVTITVNNVNITGFTIQNSDYDASGIYVGDCANVTIRNNTIKNNDLAGIDVWSSLYNSISENNITNNYYGIVLQYSVWNTLRNNLMSDNKRNFFIWGDIPNYFYHDID
ncbi:right-handed parallel beta-helix repeat-containing protein, partial [Candidatus Bathyarchaeota archaeon]|nr:right-handed parallel beta-helix repeat-containing protein [Candidatus Bathyarchaeota archaeon]